MEVSSMRALWVVGIGVCCVVCNLSIIEYPWFNETRRRCVRHQLFIGMGGCYIVLWLAVKILRGGSLTQTTTQWIVGMILAHKVGLSHSKKKIIITKSIAASIPQYLRANSQIEDINNNKWRMQWGLTSSIWNNEEKAWNLHWKQKIKPTHKFY